MILEKVQERCKKKILKPAGSRVIRIRRLNPRTMLASQEYPFVPGKFCPLAPDG
jgi:hypothetical protein